MTAEPMICIRGLKKSFGDKQVLDGVDLDILRGESMVIIGGSGTGKSVLIKHIVRLLKPDEGQVIVDGKDVGTIDDRDLNAIRKKVGVLFQGAALFDSLRVWENVGFGLKQHTKLSSKEIRAVASEKLNMVGLTNVEDLMPSSLSGGMKKRVGLARAIAMEPECILYDEPTTGLDPIMADVINDLILALREKLHVTSVTITHDMTSAYKIADRIAMLYDGRIIEVGTPDDIHKTANPVVRQFVTGSAEGPITVGVLRA